MNKHPFWSLRVRSCAIRAGVALGLTAAFAILCSVETSIRLQGHFLQRSMRAQEKEQKSRFTSSTSVTRKSAVDRLKERRLARLQRQPAASIEHLTFTPRLIAGTSSDLRGAATETTSSDIPPLQYTVHPFSKIPNWGVMRTPQEWTRRYEELSQADFVPVPSYSLPILLRPLETLKNRVTQDEVDSITAKLYYSTRYFGKYDIDAGEYSGLHPGVDLKVAEGTPVAAIGGGRVHDVRTNATLGLHLLIEHRLQNGDGLFSIYGHLESSAVKKGEVVLPGQTIGTVGMTGNTTAPHLHLQLDRTEIGEAAHQPYWPAGATVSQNEADLHSPHPLTFIRRYGAGE